MATGTFELFTDGQANVRFRLMDAVGRELAVSCAFLDVDAAVRGISAVRECAGMGLIEDHCSAPVSWHGETGRESNALRMDELQPGRMR